MPNNGFFKGKIPFHRSPHFVIGRFRIDRRFKTQFLSKDTYNIHGFDGFFGIIYHSIQAFFQLHFVLVVLKITTLEELLKG